MSIKDLTDDELRKKMSQRLIWLEKAYDESAERLDAAAGDDRHGELAEAALQAKQIGYKLRDVHIDASLLENKVVGQPMPRSGER